MDIAALVNQYGFPTVMVVGLGYFVYFVWNFVNERLQPEIDRQHMALIKLIKDSLEAAERAATRAAENTTLAKFIRNLESRIYAQLSKQLVDNMFSNDNPVRFGSFILEGSTVTYEVLTNEDGTEFIKMTIVGEDGSTTVIEIPIGSGNFGGGDDSGGTGG